MKTKHKHSRRQARTASAAFPNLQSDPRIRLISAAADATLAILIDTCNGKTATIERRLKRIAESCRVSPRTLVRHLAELRAVGLIEYEPGNGRGNLSVLRLLYPTWGNQVDSGSSPYPENRKNRKVDTSTSPHDPALSSIGADARTVPNEKEYTPTLHNDTGKPVSLSRAKHKRYSRIAQRFHKRARTAAHILTPEFLAREILRIAEIFRRYPDADRRRDAWRLMRQQYGRRSCRRRMLSVALWAVFCRDFQDIVGNIRARYRRKAYKIAKLAGKDFSTARFRELDAKMLRELEQNTGVAIGKIVKATRNVPGVRKPTKATKMATWEREVEHEEKKRERLQDVPAVGNALAQIMAGVTFAEWSKNNQITTSLMTGTEYSER